MKLAKLWIFVDWLKLLEKGKYYKTLIRLVVLQLCSEKNINYFDLLTKT